MGCFFLHKGLVMSGSFVEGDPQDEGDECASPLCEEECIIYMYIYIIYIYIYMYIYIYICIHIYMYMYHVYVTA